MKNLEASRIFSHGLPKNWAVLCIFNLLVSAFIGLLMRYKIVFSLPFVDQTYLLHAHSHFVFCGWVSLTLFSCMVAYMLPDHLRHHAAYRRIFILLEATSIGMLVAFLYQGYGVFSVFFSTLFIAVFYWFVVRFWRDHKRSGAPLEIRLFSRAALIWFVVSSFGAFVLGYFAFAGSANAIETRAVLYFYLHFQYNGWFTFAVFGLLLHWLYHIRFYPSTRKMKGVFWLLAIGVVPGYFISVIGFYSYDWIEILSALAVVLHFTAAFILFAIILKYYRHISEVISTEADILWKIATAAFFLKTALQAAVLVPSLAAFAFSFRPLIIGYLHLVFLCFISFFLIGYLLHHGRLVIRPGSPAKWGLYSFVLFVLLNEIALFAQSFCAYISVYFGFFPEALLWITVGIFLSLLIFLAGQGSVLKRSGDVTKAEIHPL